MSALEDYALAQKTTGLLVIQGGETLIERNWPLPPGSEAFAAMLVRGTAANGALLEDVASQQKSILGLLAGIAEQRGQLDITRPVSAFIGENWSKAAPDQERAITVRHVLEMTTGLTEALEYDAPAGTRFFYNTPAYARLHGVLEVAAGMPLDVLTKLWLTDPLNLSEMRWRRRPAEVARASGNAWSLVTAPRDLAALGQMILDGGAGVIAPETLKTIFAPSAANPAYGRLWWRNGSDGFVNIAGAPQDGPLVPGAPPDLVLALGAMARVLGIIPSRRAIVVRLGQQPPDADFHRTFWRLAMEVL